MHIGVLFNLIIGVASAAEPHFDTGKSDPKPILIQEILKICEKIEPNASVVIEGHTDVRGGDSYNLRLSKQRAESVKKIIESCSKNHKDIVTIGMGKNFPVSSDHSENRRVVIHLIQQNTSQIVVSEKKTEVIEKEKDPPLKEVVTVEKVRPHDWHVTGFISNGNFNLDVRRDNNHAEASLTRSWSPGLLIERRFYKDTYLGGGFTLDNQFFLGIGVGL